MRSLLMRRKEARVACAVLATTCLLATSALAEQTLERVSEYNLVSYTIVDGISIEKPLAGKVGNATNGRKLFVHRKKGNCLTCHTAPIPEQQFHGQVAPDLDGVGDRMSAGEIRLRLVNPKLANPDTPMMSYYRTHGLNQVKKSFAGKPMLNEQEIEDIVAYLVSLK